MVKTFFYEHYVTMCLFDMLLRLNVRDKLFPREGDNKGFGLILS